MDCLLYCMRTRQWFCVQGIQVQNIAGCKKRSTVYINISCHKTHTMELTTDNYLENITDVSFDKHSKWGTGLKAIMPANIKITVFQCRKSCTLQGIPSQKTTPFITTYLKYNAPPPFHILFMYFCKQCMKLHSTQPYQHIVKMRYLFLIAAAMNVTYCLLGHDAIQTGT